MTTLGVEHTEDLLALLARSVDESNQLARTQAMQELERLETLPGYCSLLLATIVNRSINESARYLALFCFKRAVDKFWVTRSSSAVSEEEKIAIRSQLPSLLDEPNNQLAIQISVVIAKIARHDFPNSWETIMEDFEREIKRAEGISDLRRLRAIQALRYIVKELQSKCVAKDRYFFQTHVPQVFESIASTWAQSTHILLNLLSASPQGNLPNEQLSNFQFNAEISQQCLRILRMFLQYGMRAFEEYPPAGQVVQYMLNMLTSFLQSKNTVSNLVVIKPINGIIKLLCKAVIDTQHSCPYGFVEYLPAFLEFFMTEFFNYTEKRQALLQEDQQRSSSNNQDAENDYQFEQRSTERQSIALFLINCMVFLKNILYTTVYQQDSALGLKANEIICNYFNADRLKQLNQILIARYFMLNCHDFEEWETNPEGFVMEGEYEDWDLRPRPCAEALYATCLSRFRDLISPIVLELVTSVLLSADQDEGAVLLRDACYHAVGLAYHDMFKEVPFSSWFTEFLMRDLQVNHSLAKVIQRRVAWVIRYWVPKISDEIRMDVYRVLLSLLQLEDPVVHLTAAVALRDVVDDCTFYPEPFLAFVQPSMVQFFQIIANSEDSETKLKMLEIIGVFIVQIGNKLAELSGPILEQFLRLWPLSLENPFMKSAIVRNLKELLPLVGPVTANYFPHLLPIVEFSIDPKSPESIYLLEDRLLLWAETLKQATSQHSELFELFKALPRVLLHTFDNLKESLDVFQYYILLGQAEFLRHYSEDVVAMLEQLLAALRDEGIMLVLKVLETILQICPESVSSFLSRSLLQLFQPIFDDRVEFSLRIKYAASISRVILVNVEGFMQLCQQTGQDPFAVVAAYIDFVLENIDRVKDHEVRKLVAMAICTLIPSGHGVVLERLGVIVNLCVDVLLDIESSSRNMFTLDYYLVDEGTTEDHIRSVVEKEKHRLYRTDPVHRFNLREFALQKLQELSQQNPELFQQTMQERVDPLIFEQLNSPPEPPPALQ